MAYNDLNCDTNFENTGSKACNESLGYWAKLIIVPTDFEIDTAANAILYATWETAINAAAVDRIRPLPSIKKLTDNTEETQYEDGVAGIKMFVREGKYDVGMILAEIAFCYHIKLRTLNNGRFSFYIVTSTNYILGTTLDDTKFLPFSSDILRIEKQTLSDGSTIVSTPVRIVGADASEWNDRGVWVKPTAFSALTLDGLQDTELTMIGTPSFTTLTLSAITTCDNVNVLGLALADFVMTIVGGAAVVITTVTDNDDGTYTIVYPYLDTAEDYTINLLAPASMTLKGYESTAALAFTTNTTTPS